MKAIVQDRFGSPDVLELRQVDEPRAGHGEVLVRVQAASLNPADWYLMTGMPCAAPGTWPWPARSAPTGSSSSSPSRPVRT